jgi:hypothetical protein
LRLIEINHVYFQILEKYCAANRPTMPNSWSYVLEQPASVRSTPSAAAGQEEGGSAASSRPTSPLGSTAAGKPNPASLITKFTKVLSQEERAMVSSHLHSIPVPGTTSKKVLPVSLDFIF